MVADRFGIFWRHNPAQVKEWFYIGPHVMMVFPHTAQDALRGINQDLSNHLPYITRLSSSADATSILVVPIANGGDRIKEEPLK